MKLISMTDFVLEQAELYKEDKLSVFDFALRVKKYAKLLKQPLTLGMFVPCDEEGNILEEPKQTSLTCSFFEQQQFFNKQKKYESAKEKVLFEGFVFTDSQKYSYLNRIPLSVSPYGINNERLQLTKLKEDNKFHTWLQLYTIEDLVQCNLELTEKALKQIGI